jgi:hypothetical protein
VLSCRSIIPSTPSSGDATDEASSPRCLHHEKEKFSSSMNPATFITFIDEYHLSRQSSARFPLPLPPPLRRDFRSKNPKIEIVEINKTFPITIIHVLLAPSRPRFLRPQFSFLPRSGLLRQRERGKVATSLSGCFQHFLWPSGE